MKKYFTKEVSIALSVIVSAVILVVGIEFLKGGNIFQATNYYYVNYSNVNGLAASTPIKINGYKVGTVKSINYDYNNHDNITVEINLDNQLRVPKGSVAEQYVDFMGVGVINLLINKDETAMYLPGDTILGDKPADLMTRLEKQILPQVEGMIPKIDAILTQVEAITGDSAIGKSLDNVEATTQQLKLSSAALTQLVSNDIPQILTNVEGITTKIDGFTTQLDEVDLAATMQRIDATLQNAKEITDKLNSPNSSMGLLLNDKALYNSMVNAIGSADSLVNDLKANPKRYVHFSIW